MRKLIIACAFAIAAAFTAATPSQAGTGITVQIGDGGYYYDHHRHHRHYRHWRHWRNDDWRDYRRSRYWRHHHRDYRRCYEERVIRFHHGNRFVEVRRICR
jgi:hypothetical protein